MVKNIDNTAETAGEQNIMKELTALFRTSVGKKLVMAVTGLMLYGFVVIHLVGNLQIYSGQESINQYAYFLKSKPIILWGFRFGLLAIFVLHIQTAFSLAAANKKANEGVPYDDPSDNGSSLASRTMIASGSLILAFVIFHILHFTVGFIFPDYFQLKDAAGHHDVYGMVVKGFQVWWVTFFYIVSMALLCFHLSHGLSALFQSLGFMNSKYMPLIEKAALVGWVAIFIGNCAIPLSILLGYVK